MYRPRAAASGPFAGRGASCSNVERLELVLARDEADARKDAHFRRRKRLCLVGKGPEERDQRAKIGVIQVVEHRRRHHGDTASVRPDAMPEQPRELRIRVAANRLRNVRRDQPRDPGVVEEHLPFGVRTMTARAAPGDERRGGHARAIAESVGTSIGVAAMSNVWRSRYSLTPKTMRRTATTSAPSAIPIHLNARFTMRVSGAGNGGQPDAARRS